MTTRECRHCDQPVESARASYGPEGTGLVRNPTGYTFALFHVGADRNHDNGHRVEAHPTCMKCGSRDVTFNQDPWADNWDCGACGHRLRFPLGD